MKPNIKDLSFKELTAFLSEHHHPVYRAKQIWQWLFQKRAITFAEMTNLSRSLREQLDENFSIGRLPTLRRAESRDGTVKFLFGLVDEVSIESVLIPEPRRLTLCVSTQAGCGFGCTFCATAVLGLKRNLMASEIVEQILEAFPQTQLIRLNCQSTTRLFWSKLRRFSLGRSWRRLEERLF